MMMNGKFTSDDNDLFKKLYDAFGLESPTIYYESGSLSEETAWDIISA